MVVKSEDDCLYSELSTLPPPRMTWEEFLDWPEAIYGEWVEGEVLILSAPSDVHQQLVTFLTTLLTVFVTLRNLGTVRVAPHNVRLGRVARMPDVLFVANENLGRIKPKYVDGAPDVVMEVISESTRDTDENIKFQEYEEAGVREYWQLDPEKKAAKFYRLGEAGKFTPAVVENNIFRSEAIPGFWLNLNWLWDNPLSHVPEALRELGAVP